MKTKTIETYLPAFSGFYGTLLEFDDSNYLDEENLTFDDIEVDHKRYELDVVKSICDYVESNCEFVVGVELENIVSPKEYNFANDSANVKITYNAKEFAKSLFDHKEELDQYLKNRYTSCSGFISSYPNSFVEWSEETNGFLDLGIDGHRLGALLDFYFQVEQGEELDLDVYYHVIESVYEGNYITI